MLRFSVEHALCCCPLEASHVQGAPGHGLWIETAFPDALTISTWLVVTGISTHRGVERERESVGRPSSCPRGTTIRTVSERAPTGHPRVEAPPMMRGRAKDRSYFGLRVVPGVPFYVGFGRT